MNPATRASFYLVATALLVAAAVLMGKQFESGIPLEPLVPCALAALGAGVFGLGLFAPPPALEGCPVYGEGGSGDLDHGDGGSE